MVKYKFMENKFTEIFDSYLYELEKEPSLSAIDCLIKIHEFLRKENINLSPKVLETVCCHPKLKLTFTSIFNKYRTFIVNDEFDKVTSDAFVILVIKCYLFLNKDVIDKWQEGYTSSNLKDYMDGLEYIKLSKEEELLLFRKIREENDLEARDFMIRNNMKLVVAVAKRYLKYEWNTLDIIEEGNYGLIVAVDKFDISKNTRFSTYACYWIDNYIKRYITENGRQIRVPVWASNEIDRINLFKENYRRRTGFEASLEEIAKNIGLSVTKVSELVEAEEREKKIVRLDECAFDDNGDTVLSLVASDSCVEEDAIKNVMSLEIKQIIDECLSPLEKEIVIARVGLFGRDIKTFKELGSIYNYSIEGVRKIYKQALLKLQVRLEVNVKSKLKKKKI